MNSLYSNMAQRNMPCTQQMLDLQLEQGPSHLHPDHCFSQNFIDFTNQSMPPMLSSSTNTTEQNLMFRDSHASSTFYSNQYHNFQNFHVVPNVGLSVAAPPSFYYPCMLPPSSSSNRSSPTNVDEGVSMDELSRNNQFVDSIRLAKRKNAGVVTGGSTSSGSSSSFLSLNSGLPQRNRAYEPVLNLVGATNSVHPEDQERGNIQQTAEGSHRSSRSTSSVTGLQPESTYFPHHNYVLQGTHIGQPVHPSDNVWMQQFAAGNNFLGTASSNWNYNPAITYLQGRALGSGSFEMLNTGAHAFPGALSRTNPPILFTPASLVNFHQHLSPMQPMQVHSYGHPPLIQAPYQLPLNNLHHISANHSSDSPDSGSRFSLLPPETEQIYRTLQMQRMSPEFTHGSVRIIRSEDAAAMGIAGLHGAGSITDQHQDMRMDIDEMTYEELLALEEQIGDVKTGLTEESIIKNLNTSVCDSQAASLTTERPSKFSQEAEACIICQVEYEKDEIIGTLNCGHNYHGECIKQWLLVKNLCPICKTAAFAAHTGEG